MGSKYLVLALCMYVVPCFSGHFNSRLGMDIEVPLAWTSSPESFLCGDTRESTYTLATRHGLFSHSRKIKEMAPIADTEVRVRLVFGMRLQ